MLDKCKSYDYKCSFDLDAKKVKRFADNVLLGGKVNEKEKVNCKKKGENESGLYPYQREAIDKFCSNNGESTYLSIVPTGGGKSLIYQSLVLYRLIEKEKKKHLHSLTLVITPLQALMKDQYKEICEMAPNNKEYFAYLNSDTNEKTKALIYERINNGQLSLLFIAPERLRYKSFTTCLEKALKRKCVNSIIFDEAHCITEWGLDFRPDYQFAAKKLVRYKIQYPFLRYMLLSATVSQTTKEELESLFGEIPDENITRSEDKTIPIKNVIKPSFINLGTISDDNERFSVKIAKVYELIFENALFNAQRLVMAENFNNVSWAPVSKIIVFTQSRKDAENGVLGLTSLIEEKLEEIQREDPKSEIVTLLSQLLGKIDFYHAGMTKIQKNNKYLRFKKENLKTYNDDLIKEGKEEVIDGDPIIILFATKAFGMGMNIKNIHMVIHFGPSMYIEDYLQEVGRACRDELLLKYISNKYNNPNATQAYCLYTSNDLDKIKERLNQEMQWPELSETFADVKRYIRDNYGSDVKTTNEYLIPLNLLQYRMSDSGDSEEHLLRNLNWFETPIWGMKEKERLLTSAKCSGHYEIGLIQKEKPSLSGDLSFIYDFIERHPSQKRLQRACFEYKEVFNCPGCPNTIKSVRDLDRIIRQGIEANLFDISYVCLQISRNEYNLKEINRFINKNQPLCALSILTKLAKEENINEEITNKLLNNNDLRPSLKNYLKGLITLDKIESFKNVASDYGLSVDKYSEMCQSVIRSIAAETHHSISFPELFAIFSESGSFAEYKLIMTCVLFCIALHYIEESPFSFDCITVKFKDVNDIDGHTPPHAGSNDLKAYELFEKRYLIKEHKVQAMRALCEADDTDRLKLIQKYIDNVQDMDSLKEYLGDEQCKMISKELLHDIINGTNEEFSLSPAQKEIYDIPEEMNICVKAGAGSGKTRVLVCRVLKYLVDLRCANEDEVLVLAYNNKVKDELRKRIHAITRKVSFSFTEDNVMTFHSFARKNCPSIRENHIQINNWENELLSLLQRDENALSGKYKYILVDEFQDVTETRLSILKELSKRKTKDGNNRAKLFVVGDAFQSIYGYDKKSNGDDPDPLHYFDEFYQEYTPETPTLLENHRSYQEIIDTAHRFIEGLDPMDEHILSQYGREEGESHPDSTCEIGPNWKDRFDEIRSAFNNLQQDNEGATMAILFRNNVEVIDASRWISQYHPELNGIIDVKGMPLYFHRLREYDEYLNRLSTFNMIDDESIISIRVSILADHPNYCETFLKDFEIIALNSFHNNKDKDISEICQIFQEMVEEKSYEIAEKSTKELTIATIHSVKGLDFDLVVIPETYSLLHNNEDEINEERRLMYVGCTRAKKLLYYPMGERERCIIAGEEYEEPQAGPAIYCDPRPCKVHMDYLCQDPDKIQYINDNVSVGDPIVIRNRIIYHNNIAIGRLIYHSPIERAMIRENLDEKAGFHITAVYKKTRTETEYLDEIRGTTYANSWAPNIDYLFYIDFELDEP